MDWNAESAFLFYFQTFRNERLFFTQNERRIITLWKNLETVADSDSCYNDRIYNLACHIGYMPLIPSTLIQTVTQVQLSK